MSFLWNTRHLPSLVRVAVKSPHALVDLSIAKTRSFILPPANPTSSLSPQVYGAARKTHDAWNIITSTASPTPVRSELSADEKWRRRSKTLSHSGFPTPAHAYSGRTVPVVGGRVLEAYARLNLLLRKNNVQKEVRAQTRHEKKGYKRRRLHSERWRRFFAHEVREKVKLVQSIRHRGG